MSALSGSFPSRTAIELQELQRQGQLQVATADAFRALVAQQGLEQAYRHTHVVVASGAEFTSQASLLCHSPAGLGGGHKQAVIQFGIIITASMTSADGVVKPSQATNDPSRPRCRAPMSMPSCELAGPGTI